MNTKTYQISKIFTHAMAIAIITQASLSAQINQRMPTGTINPDGEIGPGNTPEFLLTLNLPGIAKDVINLSNNASLSIKQDSIFKIEAIGIGLSERNDQSRGRVYVNGNSTLFYLGSQHNLENLVKNDPSQGKKTDWYWEPTGKYATLTDLQSYTKHRTFTTRPYKQTDRYGKVVDYTPIPESQRTLYVKEGDQVNIVTEFWGNSYHIANSADVNQNQMLSFFDGDLIPTTRTFDPNQTDLVDMLNNGYIEKINGTQYKAVLRPDQMITMVDYRSTARDINDMVYMVEVSNGYNDFKVFLVKMDLSLPEIKFGEDGEVLTDDDGNYIDQNGDIITQSVDYQDEMIEINPQVYNQSSPDYNPNATYQFSSPTGNYGSIYQLVFIPLTDMIFGGHSETEGDTSEESAVTAGELLVLDERMGDGVEKDYNFALTLNDPTNPNTIHTSTEDAPHSNAGDYQTLSDTPHRVSREILGFTYPSHDPLISKGTYVKLYNETTFIYEDEKTELTYPSKINQWTYTDGANIEGFSEKHPTQMYLTKSLQRFTWFLDNPTWNITTKKFDYNSVVRQGEKSKVSESGVLTPLPSDKNGEIHFICYKYHAKRYLDSVSNQIYIKEYQLFQESSKRPKENNARVILKVYAPPTGQFTSFATNTKGLSSLPSYQANIQNIYPNAKVYIRHRNNFGTGVTYDTEHPNNNKYPVKAFQLDAVRVSSPDDVIPDYIEDGEMITELVHEISYNADDRNTFEDDNIDNDSEPDDVRILDSATWTLKRRIDVQGGISTSKSTSE